ncbi:hypothetical protein BLNAU_7359 [Blattamonas nauphoetae]|uniref:Uncharacterized protein n=1 Tax=Blattamonas nauphoetae TaxID=2049346 RepID=A0ABQ9Y1U6_9EUKA|nr:hypothetical protein BLNAU_7359 [Blattamonas nauphoetae]
MEPTQQSLPDILNSSVPFTDILQHPDFLEELNANNQLLIGVMLRQDNFRTVIQCITNPSPEEETKIQSYRLAAIASFVLTNPMPAIQNTLARPSNLLSLFQILEGEVSVQVYQLHYIVQITQKLQHRHLMDILDTIRDRHSISRIIGELHRYPLVTFLTGLATSISKQQGAQSLFAWLEEQSLFSLLIDQLAHSLTKQKSSHIVTVFVDILKTLCSLFPTDKVFSFFTKSLASRIVAILHLNNDATILATLRLLKTLISQLYSTTDSSLVGSVDQCHPFFTTTILDQFSHFASIITSQSLPLVTAVGELLEALLSSKLGQCIESAIISMVAYCSFGQTERANQSSPYPSLVPIPIEPSEPTEYTIPSPYLENSFSNYSPQSPSPLYLSETELHEHPHQDDEEPPRTCLFCSFFHLCVLHPTVSILHTSFLSFITSIINHHSSSFIKRFLTHIKMIPSLVHIVTHTPEFLNHVHDVSCSLPSSYYFSHNALSASSTLYTNPPPRPVSPTVSPLPSLISSPLYSIHSFSLNVGSLAIRIFAEIDSICSNNEELSHYVHCQDHRWSTVRKEYVDKRLAMEEIDPAVEQLKLLASLQHIEQSDDIHGGKQEADRWVDESERHDKLLSQRLIEHEKQIMEEKRRQEELREIEAQKTRFLEQLEEDRILREEMENMEALSRKKRELEQSIENANPPNTSYKTDYDDDEDEYLNTDIDDFSLSNFRRNQQPNGRPLAPNPTKHMTTESRKRLFQDTNDEINDMWGQNTDENDDYT